MKPTQGITTRCPKRVEEGGILGTLEIGYCLEKCAAFHLTNAMNNCEGTCDEYKTTVWASEEHVIQPPDPYKPKSAHPGLDEALNMGDGVYRP
jgi:hypothetical protein